MFSFHLQKVLELQIASLYGTGFQRFINHLLRIKYGSEHVVSLRDSGDEGADGLILDDMCCCVACYGPDAKKPPKIAAAIKKIADDYEKYQKFWQKDFPLWRFYINHEIAPQYFKKVESFGAHCRIFGCSNICADINNLPYAKILPLLRSLNIDEDLIGRDLLRDMFDDLLQGKIPTPTNRETYQAPNIDNKIKVNSNDVDETASFHNLFIITVEQQNAVEWLLKEYDNDDISAIKLRAQQYYNTFMQFKVSGYAKIVLMIEKLNERYNQGNDDGMNLYITAFTIYLFAQCLLGRPSTE